MTLRYLALRVAGHLPDRFRLVGPAAPDERTDFPRQVVVILNSEDCYCPVISVYRLPSGALDNDQSPRIMVE